MVPTITGLFFFDVFYGGNHRPKKIQRGRVNSPRSHARGERIDWDGRGDGYGRGGGMLMLVDTIFSKVTTDEYKPILIRYYPALAQHTYGFTIVSQFY